MIYVQFREIVCASVMKKTDVMPLELGSKWGARGHATLAWNLSCAESICSYVRADWHRRLLSLEFGKLSGFQSLKFGRDTCAVMQDKTSGGIQTWAITSRIDLQPGAAVDLEHLTTRQALTNCNVAQINGRPLTNCLLHKYAYE